MPEKTYTETEIAALLDRAARLQTTQALPKHDGLTLEEIKAAAAEAGLDPRFVEMAASVSSEHEQSHWSIPTGVGYSSIVRGSLTDDHWSRMVTEFTRAFGGPGQTTVQGNHRSWSRGSLQVIAEETNGQVLLYAETQWEKELELPIALTLVGAIAVTMMGIVALLAQEWTLGVVVALLTALVGGSFSAYRQRMQARQDRLRDTFESTFDRCVAMLYDEAPTHSSARIVLPESESRFDSDSSRQMAPRTHLRSRP